MSNIINAFCSTISVDFIEKNTNDLKEEITFVSNSYQEYRGKEDCRVLEKYPKIKKILLETYKKFAKDELKFTEDFKISTSWITQIENGGECQTHCHKNSFYSGVYYFDEYEQNKGGKLELQSPLINLRDFYLVPKEWNCYNGGTLDISPRKNLLVLFPSYLFHRVLPYNGTSVRKSLSFNIVPIGSYGYGDSSYNTSWVR